jgi:hypothetical protein
MGYWPVVEDMIENVDIVILLGDARMPELSFNSELERKVFKHGKEIVYSYTKIDLIKNEKIKELKEKYKDAFFVSGTKNIGISELRRHLHILAKKMKIEEPKIGVVGYPNLGKSALINALARRARALIADKPGTTRGVQWIKAGGLKILDSPGVIPYEDKGTKLTILGSKHPEKIKDPVHVALEIIKMLREKDRSSIEERYGIDAKLRGDYEILEMIGKKRGFLKKGGEFDETKTAITVVKDWQRGKIIV